MPYRQSIIGRYAVVFTTVLAVHTVQQLAMSDGHATIRVPTKFAKLNSMTFQ